MPGYGFGYGYGAVGHVRRTPPGAGQGGTPTPTPSPDSSLPLTANIVAHFDSATIPAQADNSALAAWPDSSPTGADAAQADGARQPKYRTGGLGGQPYVEWAGSSAYLNVASEALRAVLDGKTYTMLTVVEKLSGADNASVFGAGSGGSAPWLWAGATNIGWSATSNNGCVVPHGQGSGYVSFGVVSRASYDAVAGASGLTRNVYRGTIYNSSNGPVSTTGGSNMNMGASAGGGAFPFKGRIYRIVIWDRALTPAELLQAEVYFNAVYGQTHPAVTHGRFLHLDGDSRTVGVGASTADATQRLPYKVAAALGFPPGAYGLYGVGSATAAELLAKGGEIDGMAQALAALDPAIRHRLIYEEFFNARTLAIGDAMTSGTLAHQTARYVAERRAGLPAGAKIIGQSPIDHADQNLPSASGWAEYMRANWAALGFDGLADLWASALGGDAACPNAAPFAPWADGVHLNADGQTTQAGVIAAACTALAEW